MLCSVLSICFAVSGVPQVIDGDTLRLSDTLIRIAGIDAEELNEPNGATAKWALSMLTSRSKHVTCTPVGARTYNRKVMTCRTAEGVDLAEYMVRGGWALDCEAYSGGRFRTMEPLGIRQKLSPKPYCDPNHRR
jgi:micrococcal nuclease